MGIRDRNICSLGVIWVCHVVTAKVTFVRTP